MVQRENENNAYAKFWKANKDYYGIFESGLLQLKINQAVILDHEYKLLFKNS